MSRIYRSVELVLASASPRRERLLSQLGLYKVITDPSGVGEEVEGTMTPEETAALLAARKGEEVAARHRGKYVVAADTIVVCDGKILNKPKDKADAARMLRELSGRSHSVLTALWLKSPRGQIRETVERAEVTFRAMTESEIEWYVSTGEPMDKAGGYGAQEKGALFIERIEGGYTTVVGLPLCRLGQWLAEV